ncbi:hypothetical protein [Ureaplasma canigenitalium]|uniref:hypothetical protein n=1 Tax=Ureaplasma canigenitalium TaxID=42092 RepID=UPI0004E21FDE|nr:hypothetical protein [Ureaplasma canigenitalium]
MKNTNQKNKKGRIAAISVIALLVVGAIAAGVAIPLAQQKGNRKIGQNTQPGSDHLGDTSKPNTKPEMKPEMKDDGKTEQKPSNPNGGNHGGGNLLHLLPLNLMQFFTVHALTH